MMGSAENNATITLTGDVTESVTAPAGKTLTVDLKGFSWQGTASAPALTVAGGARITLRNGKIYHQNTETIKVGNADASEDSVLNLESTLNVENTGGCAVVVSRKAYVYTKANIVATGARACCIKGEKTSPNFRNSVSVEGGTITTTDDAGASCAIYWPQGDSVLTVKGGTITGSTGIEIRAGRLEVFGGTISGTGRFKVDANLTGWTTIGAGIAVAQLDTQLKTEVVITGGTITGQVALSEANPQNNPTTAIALVNMRVSGGTFESPGEGSAVVSADCKGFITEGKFTHIENIYVDASSAFLRNAGYVVIKAGTLKGNPQFLADVIADGTLSSTAQGMAIGAVNDLPLPPLAVEGLVLFKSVDNRMYRFDGTSWNEILSGSTTNEIDDSARPVQSQAVKAAVAGLQAQIDNRYTKKEVDDRLNEKQAIVKGAASTIVTDNLPAGRVLISGDTGKVAASAITTNQLGALAGLESSAPIQEQINSLKTSVEGKVSKTVYDAHVSSMNTKVNAVEKKANDNANAILGKQDKLTAGNNITIVGNVISSTATAGPSIDVDSALSETSTNAIQNQAVTKKINEINGNFSKYATKTELSNGIAGCLPKDGTAVKATRAIQDENGNNIATTYVKKGEATGSYVSKGACTSAELDTKEKVAGHVWYLTDSRKYPKDTGDTYPAGTSWVCVQLDAGLDWVPMASGKEVDLSGYQVKDVVLLNRTVAWTAMTAQDGFTYKGVIADTNVAATDVATVVLSQADAASGNYSPICETENEKVIIYAKVNTAITIPTIVIRKG